MTEKDWDNQKPLKIGDLVNGTITVDPRDIWIHPFLKVDKNNRVEKIEPSPKIRFYILEELERRLG